MQLQAGDGLAEHARLLIAVQHAPIVDLNPHADVRGVLGPGQEDSVPVLWLIDFEPTVALRIQRDLVRHRKQARRVHRDRGNLSGEMLTLDFAEELPAMALRGPGLPDVRRCPMHRLTSR